MRANCRILKAKSFREEAGSCLMQRALPSAGSVQSSLQVQTGTGMPVQAGGHRPCSRSVLPARQCIFSNAGKRSKSKQEKALGAHPQVDLAQLHQNLNALTRSWAGGFCHAPASLCRQLLPAEPWCGSSVVAKMDKFWIPGFRERFFFVPTEWWGKGSNTPAFPCQGQIFTWIAVALQS